MSAFLELTGDTAAIIRTLETDALAVIATAPLDAVRLVLAASEIRFAAFRQSRSIKLDAVRQ